MLKRFLLTIVIMLFPLGSVLAKVNIPNPLAGFAAELEKEAKKSDQEIEETPEDEMNELEEEIEEFTPFIDTGNIGLPIAPEVISSMAEQDVPDNILNNSPAPKLPIINDEKEEEEIVDGMTKILAKENEEEDEDDNQAKSVDSQIIAKATKNKANEAQTNPQIPVEVTDAKPDASMPNEILANAPLAPEKKTTSDPAIEVKEGTKKENNAKESTKNETIPAPAPEPEAPPIPAFAKANNPPKAPSQIAKPQRPKIAIRKPTKPKEKKDKKLLRFIRDESIFILFKDDDVILGKLSDRAKLDQMPLPKYLSLYKENQKEKTGMRRAVQMEKFIKARSYIAHYPIREKELKKSIRKEIRASNLSDLRALDDYYEIIDMDLDDNGNTALHIATYEDNPAIIKWLIMRGAHLDAVNIDAITPKELAGSRRNWKIFEMLEEASES